MTLSDLENIKTKRDRIANLEDLKVRLRTQASSSAAKPIDGMPRSSSFSKEAAFERCIDEIDSINEKIIKLKQEVASTVLKLSVLDREEYSVLMDRYYDGTNMEEIARKNHYSRQTAYRVFKRAVDNLENL